MTPDAGDRDRQPIPITSDMLAEGEVGGRVEFERGMRHAPPLTLLLIAANVALFAWEVAAGALESREAIIEAGALARERVLAGEVWRFLSAAFLHGGPDHLIGNCVVLYIVGMACEHAVGFSRTALVYFASAVSGALLSTVMSPGPSVGASGAIFGVVGALVVLLYRYRRRFYVRDNRVGFVLLVWAGYTVLTGFLNPFIDNFGHIGGFLGGAGVALVVRPRRLSPTA